jgi:hypothetical protein
MDRVDVWLNPGNGPYWIELLARRSAESRTFATFVYQRSSERLLRYFTSSNENEVIWQGPKWCEQNS